MPDAMIIDKETVRAERQKLSNPARLQEVTETVRKMLDIKKTLLWRADAGTCCGSLCSIASSLSRETTILENVLSFLDKGDRIAAGRLLEEYEQLLSAQPACNPAEPKGCC
jgi:hypothetical protein